MMDRRVCVLEAAFDIFLLAWMRSANYGLESFY